MPGDAGVDAEAMMMPAELRAVADKRSGGHFTVLRFTGDWRVGLRILTWGGSIQHMAVGDTLSDAIRSALAHPNVEWLPR
jgi:hypothetical protein